MAIGWSRWCVFTPDGNRTVTVHDDGSARVWHADDVGKPAVLGEHGEFVTAFVSARSDKGVTASEDGIARIWTVAGDGKVIELKGHQSMVNHAEFSADGEWLTSANGTTCVWRMQQGRATMKIEGPKFSPHGTDVAVLSMGGVAVDRADGSGQLLQWGLRGMHIRRLAFSPDETRLAMAVLDGEVVLCDLTEKTEWEVIGRTTGDVNSLEFSPEGQRLFAAFRAEGVWCVPIDGEAGDLQIPGHARVVSLAKFSPDAGRTVTASEDGTARLWPSPPASSLQDLLWRGSSPCLKPGPRSYLFGETKDEAAAKLAACQARVAEHAALGAYQ